MVTMVVGDGEPPMHKFSYREVDGDGSRVQLVVVTIVEEEIVQPFLLLRLYGNQKLKNIALLWLLNKDIKPR